MISNNSISKYDDIKNYFKKIELHNIAIMLNPGINNFEDEILKSLKLKFKINSKPNSKFYLRISKDDVNFDPDFENNVHVITDKKVILRTKGEKTNQIINEKEIDDINKLPKVLMPDKFNNGGYLKNKFRRRRFK